MKRKIKALLNQSIHQLKLVARVIAFMPFARIVEELDLHRVKLHALDEVLRLKARAAKARIFALVLAQPYGGRQIKRFAKLDQYVLFFAPYAGERLLLPDSVFLHDLQPQSRHRSTPALDVVARMPVQRMCKNCNTFLITNP